MASIKPNLPNLLRIFCILPNRDILRHSHDVPTIANI